MPIIRPEIQEVLRQAGVLKDKQNGKSSEGTLAEKLDAAGLSLEEILDELSNIAKNSSNEALRARALETALKAHGALKDQTPPLPSFTIVIQDPTSSITCQSAPAINPILLPRQLLSQLKQVTSTPCDNSSIAVQKKEPN